MIQARKEKNVVRSRKVRKGRVKKYKSTKARNYKSTNVDRVHTQNEKEFQKCWHVGTFSADVVLFPKVPTYRPLRPSAWRRYFPQFRNLEKYRRRTPADTSGPLALESKNAPRCPVLKKRHVTVDTLVLFLGKMEKCRRRRSTKKYRRMFSCTGKVLTCRCG